MMFNKILIDLILQAKKTRTSRDKPQYEVGEVTKLMANIDYSKSLENTLRYRRSIQRY
jgi:hypothetical protein